MKFRSRKTHKETQNELARLKGEVKILRLKAETAKKVYVGVGGIQNHKVLIETVDVPKGFIQVKTRSTHLGPSYNDAGILVDTDALVSALLQYLVEAP